MGISPEFDQAVALLTSGVAEQAIPLLEREAERNPDAWEVTHALARALDLTGQSSRAASLFAQAHLKAPSEPDPACDLAMLHLAKEDDARAEQILEPAVRAHPDHPRVNLYMAMALTKTSATRARGFAAKAMESGDEETKAQARALYSVLAAQPV